MMLLVQKKSKHQKEISLNHSMLTKSYQLYYLSILKLLCIATVD